MSESHDKVTFEQANSVADKLAQVFVDAPWCGVGVGGDDEHGCFVELRIDSEVLQLKPDQLKYFVFTQEIDGVRVCLVVEEIAEAFVVE